MANINQNPYLKGLHEEAVRDPAKQTRRGSLGLVIIEPDGDDFYDNLTEEDFRKRRERP